tara:strand:- start:300 stop:836 length:537 start_codon:yes stop_codon:yes gene_type:complete
MIYKIKIDNQINNILLSNMTIMTRSSLTTNNKVSIDSNQHTIKQTTTFNHCKRWNVDDENVVKEMLHKSVIGHNDIQVIANKLGRTYGSIKGRVLSFYIIDDFDYENGDNKHLLSKYLFATEEDIEYYALKHYNKKERLNYNLNKISCLLTKIKNNSDIATNRDKVLIIIDSIRDNNN